MSKYDPLWRHIQASDRAGITLTFDEIGSIGGVPIDHSFLQHKKELAEYGYAVKKVSKKERKVTFEKC